MKIPFDKIFCINYVKSPKRRKFMEHQFKELGIMDKVEFFNAIDYSEIFSPNILNSVNHTTASFPILGCAISHYSCVSAAYERGLNSVLILEDDTCFLKDKNILEEYFNNIPENFQYIKFVNPVSMKISGLPNLYNKLSILKSNHNYCMSAYALDRNGMEIYLRNQKIMKLLAADWIIGFNINIPSNFGYFPDKLLMSPQVFLEPEGRSIYNSPCVEFDKNDFYLPDEFLVSTLNPNR